MSPLGYAANTSVSGFKGWSSQRWQLSSNIKLKRKTEQGCSEWRWCVKANLSTKVSSETRSSTCCSRVNSSNQKKKKKPASCNLLLLNSHQGELVVFCHITLNKLCKRLWHFLPSKLLHLCAACVSKDPSNSTVFFLWIILQFFLLERPLISGTEQRGACRKRVLGNDETGAWPHTYQPALIDLYKKSMLKLLAKINK